jgi:hypothetical protein
VEIPETLSANAAQSVNPTQPTTMKKRLTHIAPLQLGIVLGILYGIVSLILVPFFALAALAGVRGGGPHGIPVGMMMGGFVILLPFIYAIFGFIGGVISAAVYNLIAKWTGGIEFTTTEAV